MNSTKIIIAHYERASRSLPIISISNEVLKKLNIPIDLPLLLHYSNHSVHVLCQPHHSKENVFYIDSQLANQLHIPNYTQLHLSYHPRKKELRVGPVFAILVSRVSKIRPPFSDLNQFSEELMQVAKNRHVLAYVVSLPELLKDKSTITGWTYTNNMWKKRNFPYPQVLYNRIISRKVENSHLYHEFTKNLAAKSVSLFNQTFLDKWEVYQKLNDDHKIIPYLPKTKLFQGPLTLKEMVHSYPVLFIKPVHGSMGRGIYRVSKTWNGFDLQYSSTQGQKRKHFSQLNHLYTFLASRIKSKRFIVQEGIPILHLHERPVDFRILMQKNKTGKWAVTSMVSRIGPINRFVSNIARGGEISRIITTLKKCCISQPHKIRRQLLSIAKLSCESIEAHNPGLFAELGVDLAVTRSGKIYLLELNSKPSKSDNTVTLPNNKGRPSVHRLLDYTLFLTNYQKIEV